jgi:hypothetical protein
MFYPVKGKLLLNHPHVKQIIAGRQEMYLSKISKGMTKVFTHMMGETQIINPITILLNQQYTINKLHPGGARLMAAYTRGFETLDCVVIHLNPYYEEKCDFIVDVSRDLDDLQMVWSAGKKDWCSISTKGQGDYMTQQGHIDWSDTTDETWNKKIMKKWGCVTWFRNGEEILHITSKKQKIKHHIQINNSNDFFDSLLYLATENTFHEKRFTVDRIQ